MKTKLRNHLKIRELRFATDEQIRAVGSVPGFASPMGIDFAKTKVVFDHSAAESSNLVVGANEGDYHFKNFNFERDLASAKAQIEIIDLASARAGDPCPVTGLPLTEARGIEVGNIFQLGTKYSKAMNCTFLDSNGKSQFMIMGCYGIGVGRSMAAVIEQSHDDYGPIWPISIAPYHVHICALNLNEPAVREAAEGLAKSLSAQGVEVLYDDRNEKAGSAFNDADLIGIPYRLVISPKNLATGCIELKTRDKSLNEQVPLAEAHARILGLVQSSLSG